MKMIFFKVKFERRKEIDVADREMPLILSRKSKQRLFSQNVGD
jgi:hypothetical protein